MIFLGSSCWRSHERNSSAFGNSDKLAFIYAIRLDVHGSASAPLRGVQIAIPVSETGHILRPSSSCDHVRLHARSRHRSRTKDDIDGTGPLAQAQVATLGPPTMQSAKMLRPCVSAASNHDRALVRSKMSLCGVVQMSAAAAAGGDDKTQPASLRALSVPARRSMWQMGRQRGLASRLSVSRVCVMAKRQLDPDEQLLKS